MIGIIVVGLIAGWLADEILGGDSFGLLGNLLLGLAGAFIGGLIFGSRGMLMRIVAATIGALILLFVVGLIQS